MLTARFSPFNILHGKLTLLRNGTQNGNVVNLSFFKRDFNNTTIFEDYYFINRLMNCVS
jgi:hypothetical protein